jgi:phosphoadenosine phosphosulfate reductase
MSQVRLGRISLHWCRRCGVPLLDRRPCGICGERPASVAITPPGDARPAFPFDLDMVRGLADSQFGTGAGMRLLPDGEISMLNRIPDLDRTDEVIAGGEVLANMTWVMGKGFALQLRIPGAARIGVPSKGWVLADEGAVPSILESSNLLGPGVVRCSPGIQPMDEVVVLDNAEGQDRVLGTGSARMPSEAMGACARGTAVKVRWRRGKDVPNVMAPPVINRTWEDVLRANRAVLKEEVERAVDFIREGASKLGKEAAVSYSGGKDSLATLLLVLEAGLRPKVVFIDTGLEFPETVQNARDVSARLGLELLVEDAGGAFWENVPRFGPPARDARWCCKCCKLGPVTRLISRQFPDGVLSFIGQRRYESEARASKGPVWKNPWVPGQIGASPIQEWPALQVWLYLFDNRDKAPWNPWYERGLERIGCFLCPATNFADLELVRNAFPGYERWQRHLEAYPETWRTYGLWRWRRLPRGVREHLAQRGVVVEAPPAFPSRLSFEAGKMEASDNGAAVEGRFSRPLELETLSGRLHAMGKARLEGDRLIVGEWAELCRDGTVLVRAGDEQELKRRIAALEEAVLRAEECAGCGICTGRCKTGAASIRNGKMVIDPEKCTQCGACLTGPCPATAYGQDDL